MNEAFLKTEEYRLLVDAVVAEASSSLIYNWCFISVFIIVAVFFIKQIMDVYKVDKIEGSCAAAVLFGVSVFCFGITIAAIMGNYHILDFPDYQVLKSIKL